MWPVTATAGVGGVRRFEPRLTEARRAGLLAAVAVYPLSRLAGTLPRPALDRALVSGTSMAVAFQAARATTAALRTSQGYAAPSPLRQAVRTAALATIVTAGAVAASSRTRSRARAAAAHGERLAPSEASVGAAAELLAVAAGASALVAVGDTLLLVLPGPLRNTHPAVRGVAVVLVGGALGAGARNARLLDHLALPAPEGAVDAGPQFQKGAALPIAVARSAGVAVVAIAVLAADRAAAHWLARTLTDDPEPTTAARVAGHAVLTGSALMLGAAGFAFYSSRVAVQERLLEDAYAAVPERHGVTGGSSSAYDFADLGREGRRFVSQAHTADELTAVLGRPASDPVRAWVPYEHVTGVVEADAAAIVSEIERLGGFQKGTLVLAAPTGDGYVSYVQTESVEMLTAGDCATAAVPYANVPSAVAMPRRARAAEAYAAYARAIAARARELKPDARLFTFGESLGSIVALDAFGPDIADELREIGFQGGLYCGVPVYSRTDRALRPRHPDVREQRGLQYATGRDLALLATPGHLNVTHPTDPVAVADPTTFVRHHADYWGRPYGVHVPLVSFLVHLFDVKNAMNLRPGQFTPSPGHDYRYDTAAAVARAYGLPFDDEELVETALRERELSWSVRRLLSRRVADARDSALTKLRSWGVEPETIGTRFRIAPESLPEWLQTSTSTDVDTSP
jgi:uncharacterized membrane protein